MGIESRVNSLKSKIKKFEEASGVSKWHPLYLFITRGCYCPTKGTSEYERLEQCIADGGGFFETDDGCQIRVMARSRGYAKLEAVGQALERQGERRD